MKSAMALRPYQEEAKDAIFREWESGHKRTLLVLPTGTGKTIVFAKVAEECVKQIQRVLILAHRSELLEQASDKIKKTTGLGCTLEKAGDSCLDSFYRITVGSVQTLMRQKRLEQFAPDFFDTIIIDEAHHVVSKSYQNILDHFSDANVLGVTATPDRGDMKSLGQAFESLAYEYTLPQAIKDGYLSHIKAQTIPLQVDISKVGTSAGDFKAGDLGSALDPYLEQIADEMLTYCAERKTIVFLPLIATSQKFCRILNEKGFRAVEVNGESKDREEAIAAFQSGEYNVICNSMLLTEGWDCPQVDCVIVLRPTKIRGLYCQMIGRGTRICEGKDYLLILDFLWQTGRMDLCRPAHLICESPEVSQQMTENLESGMLTDIEEAEAAAEQDVIAAREEALAAELAKMRKRKKKLVDPIQYEMSIGAIELTNYMPSFGWETEPMSDRQKEQLERLGINPDEIGNAGKAQLILDKLHQRIDAHLATPKQIRLLENYGFQHVGQWKFDDASSMISRISMHHWSVPYDIDPEKYDPQGQKNEKEESDPFLRFPDFYQDENGEMKEFR